MRRWLTPHLRGPQSWRFNATSYHHQIPLSPESGGIIGGRQPNPAPLAKTTLNLIARIHRRYLRTG